jgi:hypothetical protein
MGGAGGSNRLFKKLGFHVPFVQGGAMSGQLLLSSRDGARFELRLLRGSGLLCVRALWQL